MEDGLDGDDHRREDGIVSQSGSIAILCEVQHYTTPNPVCLSIDMFSIVGERKLEVRIPMHLSGVQGNMLICV